MDERKRPQRDEEAETDQERREEEEEEQGEKEEDEEREGGAEEKEEEEEKEARPDLAVHAAEMLVRMHRVLHEKVLDVDESLPDRDRRALEMLYMARIGETSGGDRASAAMRMQYLVEALARLQPILAMARSPLLHALDGQFREIRSDVSKLRRDIRHKASEIHVRKRRRDKQQGTDEAERSRDGELAWQVAELARKKRARFAHDPRKHPIGHALERIGAELIALGKIAAEMAAIDGARQKETDAGRRAELDGQWQERGAALAARLSAFLAGCRAGAADPQQPGAHPPLVEAFAPLLGEADGELDAGEAVGLAARVAAIMDELLDGQDALVAGQAPDDDGGGKPGLIGRLFGRKGE